MIQTITITRVDTALLAEQLEDLISIQASANIADTPAWNSMEGIIVLLGIMLDIARIDAVKSDSSEPEVSDGSTAAYYELPEGAKELQDIISANDMNAQIGEIFRKCKRYGKVSHSEKLRDAKGMRFYIDAEIQRLEKYENEVS